MALSDQHSTSTHVYEALQGPEHIRLIALHPASSKDAPLRIGFTSSTLEDLEGRYEAVSYTWGEPIKTFALHVDDGTQVCVTRNLDRALRYLRYKDRDRLLWADAASINQDNNKEKEVQIPLMVKIFRGAHRVMAWLDPGRDTTVEQQGMRTLNHLSRNHKTEREEIDRNFSGVLQFLKLPWFNRLWIVQEVVFNLEICLMCGETELSFSRLLAALSVIKLHRPLSDHDGEARMKALEEINSLWTVHSLTCGAKDQHRITTSIEYLVEEFSSYECSDPRDRIFALCSMATNVRPGEPIPQKDFSRLSDVFAVYMNIDYSLDERETYENFAFTCLGSKQVRAARLIWNAVFSRLRSPQPVTWPSWVPDWRVAPKKTRIPSTSDSYFHMKVAKFTASIMRVDVPFVTRYRDISGGRLYTVTSKLSRRSNGSQVQFETQLLQLSHMYRVLQKQEIVWDSDVPLSRPGSTSGELRPIYFPNCLVKMIRLLVGVNHDEDFPNRPYDSDDGHLDYGYFINEDSDDEDSDDEDSDDEGSDDEVSYDREIILELERYLANMAVAPEREGLQRSLISASDHLRGLINDLGRNLGDEVDLFCFYDPRTQVNSVGYGSTALEPGDRILAVGDMHDMGDLNTLMEVFILRKSCSVQGSDEEKPVYRLVGRGYIFDPTAILLRSAKLTKDGNWTRSKEDYRLGSLHSFGYRRSKQTVYLT